MKSQEERLRSYEPMWENWHYTGELLGSGGMASVYEIKREQFGINEFSALKVITVEKNSLGAVPGKAIDEIRIMKSLSYCPNIVKYYDDAVKEIKNTNGSIYGYDILIRMEKLIPIMDIDCNFNEKDVILLAHDICAALAFAHKKKIIHRDVKPQNIFVNTDGIYKLGDFGIAKVLSETGTHYTKDVGTGAYASPEVYRGKKYEEYDSNSDLYSLGLVMYVYLNENRLPFVKKGASYQDIISAVDRRLDGAAFDVPLHGSEKLKKIVMKACAFKPGDRYRSADEMLADIDELTDNEKHKKMIDPFATREADNEDIKVSLTERKGVPVIKNKAPHKPDSFDVENNEKYIRVEKREKNIRKEYKNGFYFGEIKNGVSHGYGKYVWKDGDIYEGAWKNGKRTGTGKFTWSDGDVYEGDFIDGKRTGTGKFTWVSGNVYEGDFIDGKRTGKGRFTWSDGDVYEGDFNNDKRTGKGRYTWANGNVYEGDWQNGKQYGKGRFTWSGGDVYEGDFIDGKRTGKGRYIWPNGDVYEGSFIDGKRTGTGKLTRSNGEGYRGDFMDGKRTGKGRYTWPNGDAYEGGFADNVPNGKGKYEFYKDKCAYIWTSKSGVISLSGISKLLINKSLLSKIKHKMNETFKFKV